MKKWLSKIVVIALLAMAITAGSTVLAFGAASGTPGEIDYIPGDFTVYEGRDDLNVTLGANGSFSLRFDIPTSETPGSGAPIFNNRNTTAVQKYDGLKYYIYFNGTPYSELAASTYKFNFHLRNVEFYCYNDGYTFNAGDTFTFKKGLYFPLGVADGKPIEGYQGRLGNDFSVRLSAGGSWTVVKPEGSAVEVSSISTITEVAAGAIKPATLEFETKFDSEIAINELTELETLANYSENIFINGKSVKNINETTEAVDNEGEKINAVTLSAFGAGLKVSVVKSTNIVELGKNLSFKIGSDFVTDTKYVISEDIMRYYVNGIEYWSNVEPYKITRTTAVNIDSVADFEVIDNGANGSFDITFKENIADKTYLAYNFHPAHLPTLPDAYKSTKDIAASLGSSGATESILDNVFIKGESLRTIWAKADSIDAKSNMYQIHILQPNVLSIRSSVSNLSPLEDITIVLKKGLEFYSGAYLDHDVKIDYKATGEETSYTVNCESIKITCDKTTLNIGETATVTAEFAPIDATNVNITYVSSDTSILTVDADGKVTAIKKGTATVKAVSGTVESNVVTINVILPVTGITVGSPTVSLEVGKTSKIVATIAPIGADATITYSSDKTDVATVSADGTITAVKAGTAVITVTADGKTATVTVTVTAPDKGGCNSSVAGSSLIVLLSILTLGGALLILRKKQSN